MSTKKSSSAGALVLGAIAVASLAMGTMSAMAMDAPAQTMAPAISCGTCNAQHQGCNYGLFCYCNNPNSLNNVKCLATF